MENLKMFHNENSFKNFCNESFILLGTNTCITIKFPVELIHCNISSFGTLLLENFCSVTHALLKVFLVLIYKVGLLPFLFAITCRMIYNMINVEKNTLEALIIKIFAFPFIRFVIFSQSLHAFYTLSPFIRVRNPLGYA